MVRLFQHSGFSVPFITLVFSHFYLGAGSVWEVSRLDLHLVPTHPDRAAGLGFLGESAAAFMTLLLSQGVLLAGQLANHNFYTGETLLYFKPEIVAGVVFFLLLVLSPLCVFATRLAQVKREGLLEYGTLTSLYVEGFDQKWLRGGAPTDEQLVGTGDIQSLNDLAGSFEIVHSMRPIPFDKTIVLQTAVAGLAPLFPLALTMVSLEEIIKRLLGILL
ncbi:MAG: hypothetical protein WCP96_15185 [Methylococcaceae bacterium]